MPLQVNGTGGVDKKPGTAQSCSGEQVCGCVWGRRGVGGATGLRLSTPGAKPRRNTHPPIQLPYSKHKKKHPAIHTYIQAASHKLTCILGVYVVCICPPTSPMHPGQQQAANPTQEEHWQRAPQVSVVSPGVTYKGPRASAASVSLYTNLSWEVAADFSRVLWLMWEF